MRIWILWLWSLRHSQQTITTLSVSLCESGIENSDSKIWSSDSVIDGNSSHENIFVFKGKPFLGSVAEGKKLSHRVWTMVEPQVLSWTPAPRPVIHHIYILTSDQQHSSHVQETCHGFSSSTLQLLVKIIQAKTLAIFGCLEFQRKYWKQSAPCDQSAAWCNHTQRLVTARDYSENIQT